MPRLPVHLQRRFICEVAERLEEYSGGQCCKFVARQVCVIGSSVRRREQPENEAVQ
jgi:hypothetical protein